MSLKIITGPASSGKTNLICNEIVKESLLKPEERFIVITPEQASFQTQSKIISMHPAHASLNIDVSSFEHLAYKVFAKLGIKQAEILDDTGKTLIMRKIINENRAALRLYSGKAQSTGFTEQMMSMITELIQYDINDDKLFLMEEAASDDAVLSAKLHDVRLIFDKFNNEIKERYISGEQLLDIFAKTAADSDIIRGANIYFDGFTGFTPIQYNAVRTLLKTAASVTVAITLPDNEAVKGKPEFDLFDLSRKTYFKLKELAQNENISVEEDETTGGSKGEIPGSDEQMLERLPGKVFLFKAGNPTGEVEFTANRINELVRENGLRYKEIACIASDMEIYADIFKEVFEKAGIPVFIDDKNPLYDNPLARMLMFAIKIADTSFRYDGVFSFIKTGMPDMTADELCALENYCLEFGINGLGAWKKEFKRNKKLKGSDKLKWDLEELNRIREGFMTYMLPFYNEMTKPDACAGDYADALLKLFEELKCEEKLEKAAEEFKKEGNLTRSGEYERIYGLVTGLIEKTKELLKDSRISLKDYEDIMESGLSKLRVGIAPPALDSLLVGDLIRTRLDNTRVLFLVGANDGNIPKASSGSIILTQRERRLLKERTGIKAELAPTVTEDLYIQRFYLYNMLSKPKDSLYITCAAVNSGDEELSQSYLIDSVLSLRSDAGIIREKSDTVYWKNAAVNRLAREISGYVDTGKISEDGIKLVKFFDEKEPDTLEKLIKAAVITNEEVPLEKEAALKLYGAMLKGSVSRFEDFSQCAFKHFIKHGLGIEKRPEYRLEAADIGTVYHSSIEKYSKELYEKGFTFADVPDNESREIIDRCVEDAVRETGSDIFSSSVRNEYLLKRIKKVACKTTDVLRTHIKAGLFKPEYFELSFVTEDKDKLRFKGKIDRVDIYDDGDIFVKVIDYKSGNKGFSFLDIYTGTQMQLTAYMAEALKKVKRENPGKNVRPGGVYYYLINDKYSKDDKAAAEKNRMSGLTNTDMDFDAIDKGLKETNKSSIVNLSITKDGSSKGTGGATEEEFERLIEFVDEKTEAVADAIHSGCIEIRPYEETADKTACGFCDYKDICKFEPVVLHSDFKRYPGLDNSKAREIINKTVEAEEVLSGYEEDENGEEE